MFQLDLFDWVIIAGIVWYVNFLLTLYIIRFIFDKISNKEANKNV